MYWIIFHSNFQTCTLSIYLKRLVNVTNNYATTTCIFKINIPLFILPNVHISRKLKYTLT